MEYLTSKDMLTEALLEQFPQQESNRNKMEAMVSHWLHIQDVDVPFMTEQMQAYCFSILEESLPNKNGVVNHVEEPYLQYPIVWNDVPFPPNVNPQFTFIDLFAGIGGFRIAMQELGGKCVFSSEWDVHAQKTYEMNFGEIPFGDIRDIPEDDIPDHDVLCAGFPCQPFSLAGVSARNALNTAHGFACETQGTLFFDIARIVEAKRPKIVFLENVKNLVRHDNGKTFATIRKTIESLGYSFSYKVIDASPLVPQKRVRCYMVCIRDDQKGFEFPEIQGSSLALETILEEEVDESFTISSKLWAGHQRRTKRNLERGTGFTAFCADVSKPSNTIVARYGKDGKECLIPQPNKNPRMLTPRECARLQGFPENFIIPSAKTKAYRQFGNSVAIPVIKKIAEEILVHLDLEKVS